MVSAPPPKRADVRVALEKLLREGQARNERKVFRDRRRRVILVHESALDPDKLLKSGRSLAEVGRRIRHYDATLKQEIGPWIVPAELAQLSREEPEAVAGVELPLGTVVANGGLWLKYRAGIEEIGVSDRGEIVLREVPDADPASGPVRHSIHTVTREPARAVARAAAADFDADRREVEAWLKLLASLDGKRPHSHAFKCAGIDFTHRGNVAHLQRTAQLAFFDPRDIDMVRIASLLAFRFRKVKRRPPTVTILSVGGVPSDVAGWNALQKRLKTAKKASQSGLPQKLAESRFYDPQTKTVGPAVIVLMRPLRELPDEITVLTVNTDDHEDFKGRAVLSALLAILSPVDIITARGGIAVLSSEGTAATFNGPAGTGRSTACLFWAGRDEKVRRKELRRRYEMDLRRTPDAGRLGETGIQKELDRLLAGIGALCQEASAAILKEGAGQWTFWPTERVLHAATDVFPGLPAALQEHAPLLENVCADFGAGGRASALGRVTHRYPGERVYYDPAWNHLVTNRAAHRIAANIILDRAAGDWLVRRLAAREAIERFIAGRSPDGRFEPLFNATSDVSSLLIQSDIVGPRLVEAYEAAKGGEFAALGNGDAVLGEAIFDRLDGQVKLWLDNCRETPTFLVNTAWGLELTQDVHWMISQHPDALGEWRQVTVEQFRHAMRERYGVTYGPSGEWTHIAPDDRLD